MVSWRSRRPAARWMLTYVEQAHDVAVGAAHTLTGAQMTLNPPGATPPSVAATVGPRAPATGAGGRDAVAP